MDEQKIKVFKLTRQKEKLIRMDIEKYMMGQIQLKSIVEKRKVTIGVVQRILNKIVNEKMHR